MFHCLEITLNAYKIQSFSKCNSYLSLMFSAFLLLCVTLRAPMSNLSPFAGSAAVLSVCMGKQALILVQITLPEEGSWKERAGPSAEGPAVGSPQRGRGWPQRGLGTPDQGPSWRGDGGTAIMGTETRGVRRPHKA